MTISANDFGGGHSPRELDVATGTFEKDPPSAALARSTWRRPGRLAGMLATGALMLFGYRLAGAYNARTARQGRWLGRWAGRAARRRSWFGVR